MNFGIAFAIAFYYYFASSTWFIGLGFRTLTRPLISGTIVGLLLGDVKTGIILGSKIQLIYMGFISAGGSMPSDMTLAGVVGTTLGIVMRPQLGDAALDAALALAVALGMVGTIAYIGRMTWNSFFTHISEREMVKGNLRGVFFWNVWAPQLVQAAVQIIPVTLFLMALNGNVLAGLNSLIKTVVGPLAVVGSLLPTLGLALNLRGIAKKTTMPFFFLGFILVQYLKMDVVSIAVLGLIIAYLMTFGKEETSVQA